MTLIETKILSNSRIETYFYASRIIPSHSVSIFLKEFVDEKLNPVWFLRSYCDLKKLQKPVSDDLIGSFNVMRNDFSSVLFVMEIFYFDSFNRNDKETDFAFRWYTVLDSSESELNDLLSGESAQFYKNLEGLYGGFFTDPYFKLDKIRIRLDFRK